MNNEGISLDEACAARVIGTSEDFDRNCNEDGTVKEHPKTTTFTLRDNDAASITIRDSYLHAGLVALLLLVVVVIFLLMRARFNKKNT